MASHDSQKERLPGGHARLVAAALILLVVAATAPGIAARLTPDRGAPSASAGPEAPATQPVPIAGIGTASATAETAPIASRSVACRNVHQPECARIVGGVGALVRSAALPGVSHIDVYSSILCDSSLDCPPSLLARARSMGSAVVSFAGGRRQAWVDVVYLGDGPASKPEAWIVRWVDATARSAGG